MSEIIREILKFCQFVKKKKRKKEKNFITTVTLF